MQKSYWLIAEAEIKTSSKKRGVLRGGVGRNGNYRGPITNTDSYKKRYLDYLLVEIMEKNAEQKKLAEQWKKKARIGQGQFKGH